MSAFTPHLVRSLIDYEDALFREAVEKNNLRQAFDNEKRILVSQIPIYIIFIYLH